jgi:orotidine-5'-phosphate decarboxylase
MSSEVETSLTISVEASPSKTETARDSSTSVGMTKITDKIIVALDVATKREAVELIAQLREQISFFKIGLQLYTAEGPEIVRAVLVTGAKVLLDLKLHDIPNTVARAVESTAQLGVQMLTIHLSGGAEMIRAAVGARKSNMSILGVTVLTSATAETLREVGVADELDRQVLRLAKLGVAHGVDGLIASPQETNALRAEFGNKVKIVTPGIRPRWTEAGDQKRFMTPRQAIEAGADYLVIGRPITSDPSPRDAVARIVDELSD